MQFYLSSKFPCFINFYGKQDKYTDFKIIIIAIIIAVQ